MSEEVLVDVTCDRCGATHDAWAEAHGGPTVLRVPSAQLLCPNCYPRRTSVTIRERESLA